MSSIKPSIRLINSFPRYTRTIVRGFQIQVEQRGISNSSTTSATVGTSVPSTTNHGSTAAVAPPEKPTLKDSSISKAMKAYLERAEAHST